jgi:hypothetical protein
MAEGSAHRFVRVRFGVMVRGEGCQLTREETVATGKADKTINLRDGAVACPGLASGVCAEQIAERISKSSRLGCAAIRTFRLEQPHPPNRAVCWPPEPNQAPGIGADEFVLPDGRGFVLRTHGKFVTTWKLRPRAEIVRVAHQRNAPECFRTAMKP